MQRPINVERLFTKSCCEVRRKNTYDGTFTYGETEDNAARSHQIASGLYNGCFISTTKDLEVATRFATNQYPEEGWIYVINPSLFSKFGVSSREFYNSRHPEEQEVSIKANDCMYIPENIIFERYEVRSNGTRKNSL